MGLLFLASMIETRQEEIPGRARLYLHGLCGLLLKAGVFAVGGFLAVVPFLVALEMAGLNVFLELLGEIFGGHLRIDTWWLLFFRGGFICLALGLIGRLLLHWLPESSAPKNESREDAR